MHSLEIAPDRHPLRQEALDCGAFDGLLSGAHLSAGPLQKGKAFVEPRHRQLQVLGNAGASGLAGYRFQRNDT